MNGIVVGVDGSEGSKHALEWAAKEAHLRGVPLTVVLAWQWPTSLYAGAGWVSIDGELIEDLRKLAEQRLEETCAAVASSLDGVDVRRSVVEGAAAPALADAAKGAELLVVGTRGHGGFAGLLLGSVSQQCAHHSPCPIVIVPPQQT
jgi:Universal stress protein UspA and related nucleotide-binding proteins